VSLRLRTTLVAVVAALLGSTGCRVLVEIVESDTTDGGANVDANTDQGDAGIDCRDWSFSPAHFDPCDLPVPSQDLVLRPGMWSYDTNSGALTDPESNASFPAGLLLPQDGGPEIRVISVHSLTIENGAILRPTGKRPLVIVSWTDMTVSGTIDVSSAIDYAAAGANPTSCDGPATLAGTSDANGSGGGGGGALAADGGGGGDGSDGAALGGVGGSQVSLPGYLLGGCPGGRGGGPLGGARGNGGGALHLAARGMMTIDGILNAGGSGAGGSGGSRSGGGGAGSGGLVDLQADMVSLGSSAVLVANGGGGGGGSDNNAASPGEDAHTDATAALGGTREGAGGDGGDGGYADSPAEDGQDATRGGGGGGGGVGFIVIHASNLDNSGAVISPDATTP